MERVSMRGKMTDENYSKKIPGLVVGQHSSELEQVKGNIAQELNISRLWTTYLGRLELDTGLDDIDGGKGSVCDGAADSSSESSLKVEHEIILVKVVERRSQKSGTGRLGSSRHDGG